MTDRPDLRRLRANLQGEIDSAALYLAMAAHEPDAKLAEVYRQLAAVEQRHAEFWRRKLAAVGAAAPAARPGWRTRVLIWLAGRFGAAAVLPLAASLEQVDRGIYDDQPETRDTKMPAQERSHARLLSALSSGRRSGWNGAVYARLEGRHGSGGGNALRAAVLGANDGLVSNLSLVMGVAGAAFSERTVLLTGLAGLIAGACSMAMGEWLSVQNARELYAKEIAAEADELAQVPDEEKEELVLIYRAKGLSEDQARSTAEQVMANRETALDTLAREELGIDPDDLGGSPWAAALSSFGVFIVGAIVPVAPFFFMGGIAGVATSAAASAMALFAIGVATTLFTGRGAGFAGLRQVAVGLAAAAVTYGMGRILGATVGG
ncbi:MAG TPA: VIT1/CCC1 family protein [Casimicrobiaceae bacterium]|nr:VIT1/CCC1 family protein [Casimicrobiaceae bacterium]